ncbi:MAG: D-aminoacyl-tRNA deacylase [Pseudomonadota bacterium]
MRALIQRVTDARVTVAGAVVGAVVGEIGPGLLVLVCAMPQDDSARLRIFRDAAGKMNLSLTQTGGAALVVSQFTLAADLRGNRPGFSAAAPPDLGERLCRDFVDSLAGEGIPTATGIFGADMAVALTNDGPVTIWMDSDAL